VSFATKSTHVYPIHAPTSDNALTQPTTPPSLVRVRLGTEVKLVPLLTHANPIHARTEVFAKIPPIFQSTTVNVSRTADGQEIIVINSSHASVTVVLTERHVFKTVIQLLTTFANATPTSPEPCARPPNLVQAILARTTGPVPTRTIFQDFRALAALITQEMFAKSEFHPYFHTFTTQLKTRM
jgi:hypothetical protein